MFFKNTFYLYKTTLTIISFPYVVEYSCIKINRLAAYHKAKVDLAYSRVTGHWLRSSISKLIWHSFYACEKTKYRCLD